MVFHLLLTTGSLRVPWFITNLGPGGGGAGNMANDSFKEIDYNTGHFTLARRNVTSIADFWFRGGWICLNRTRPPADNYVRSDSWKLLKRSYEARLA